MNAIILSPAQIGHWDLVCALRSCYPKIPIMVGQQLQTVRWQRPLIVAAHPLIPPIIVHDDGRHEPMKMTGPCLSYAGIRSAAWWR